MSGPREREPAGSNRAAGDPAVDGTAGAAGTGGTAGTGGLIVEGLTVSYPSSAGPAVALHGVSLRIRPGETYGLVGESGCGKSTLAAALAGVLPGGGGIDAGRIALDGVDVRALSAREHRRWRASAFAMVHQGTSSSLDPTIRVGAQVAEVCRLAGLSRAQARSRAVELLGAVRLPEPATLARRWPHELSGGQQQRVGIAAALAGSPRLLVLDEPTTGLDPAVEREILDLIQALRRQIDAAVLLISHDLALVARTCERVGVLYAGRLVEQGAAADLLTSPRHPYTAALVAAVPRVGVSRRERRMPALPGQPPAPTDRPAGCAFADRCALADEVCRTSEPPLAPTGPTGSSAGSADLPEGVADLSDGHTVRCHHSIRVDLPRFQEQVNEVAAEPARPGLLTVRGLSRSYGRTPVLTGIDLDIAHGEVLGLVGESGSGKTTLARAVVGLGPHGPGEIRLDGRPLPVALSRRRADDRRRVQMVFQDPDTTLNPRHTVGMVLRRALATLRGEGTVADLAGRVQLGPRLLPMRTPSLSGGQKQRVAIGRAFAGDPRLVVCDEPVSALDVSVQAAVLELLATARDAHGVSYLFVSHDLAVVGYLADRVAVLYRGRIVEVGPATAVLLGPHHPYTHALTTPVDPVPPGRAGQPGRPGQVRRGSTAATGCGYAESCPRRIDGLCDFVDPPLLPLGGGVTTAVHSVRCHLDAADLPVFPPPAGPAVAAAAEDEKPEKENV
ncbi:Oligopeptide/dipeptide ABC transporter, ATP-binding protein [Frankia canadensis]|uniref:Oligopeptide/dipeptide ABC transporter, ATP-binding protein n=1 Tax=Frankia canadensis TaxID=1836972 RepID=A0A2I2KQ13_9ACTN|nr:ABC transporter ATP-binding protein [Frankia canadensis]SNQ47749.1 Oligopeptide/dipeptide ABC transporter, ATP-binding protein [Frankia canadensis]SOU55039.1 Oligopeptide/dipeptide ABC transporter, ATP-binding protein [Frankia canadensis]